MRLSETLCDLGKAVPGVLDSIVTTGDAATALECVRHAACTGALEALGDPPPALRHASKLPTADMLYGGALPPPFPDAPYRHESIASFATATRHGSCVGGVLMDVCKGQTRPAVIYAEASPESNELKLTMHVYSAPLASMEAELFDSSGAPTGLEQRWLRHHATEVRDLRGQMGQFIRGRGYNKTPPWLHSDDVVLERSGALPLLRVRLPSTEVEKDDLRAVLEREHWPSGGVQPLKDILVLFSTPRINASVRTFFHARAQDTKPEPEDEDGNCVGALDHSVIAPLSLLILKHLEAEDFYSEDNGEEAAAQWSNPPDNLQGADMATTILETAMEDVASREALASVSTDVELAGTVPCPSGDLLMRLVAPTLLSTDMKLVLRAASDVELAMAIARAFFSASDALLLKRGLAPDQPLQALLEGIGTSLELRHAILLVSKSSDARITACRLFSHEGSSSVPMETVTRFLLMPWVIPLVMDGSLISEVKVNGVIREQLQLREDIRLEGVCEHSEITLPASITALLETTASACGALSSIEDRLLRIEQSVTAPASGPTEAAVPLLTLPVPVVPVVKAVTAVAAVAAVESETTRSLKRTIAHLTGEMGLV